MNPSKKTHTTTDTIELTPAKIKTWKKPPFQRALRVNAKVRALAEQLRADGGVVPGVIHLGVCNGVVYLLDGQHRLEAFGLAELPLGYADVRTRKFATIGEMGREFVELNSRLVQLRPDDIVQGLEPSHPALRLIREKCPFVGYGHVGRGKSSAILSMAMTLKCWHGSSSETPAPGGHGSALDLAEELTSEEASYLCSFLALVFRAWGRDASRMWGALNLTLCAWLYRRIVNSAYSTRTTTVAPELFAKGVASLAADGPYGDWLVGRTLRERDRSPAYARMKVILAKRFLLETGTKHLLPMPPWAHA
ncbi:MAG: hypothetical protein AAB706_03335 [Patescibacteria group bacterium]